MVYDSIIVGGGPAGLTAALYLGRYQKKTLLITGDIGGQTAIAGTIENFPGFTQINGFELANKILQQIKELESVEVVIGSEVKSLETSQGSVTVRAGDSEFIAKTLLIAAGKRHRELGLENEQQLIGKGLSYCATCDGPFAKGKDIIIVGGGYAATEAALILNKIANKVFIVNIGGDLSGENLTIEKIKSDQNIEVINDAKTVEITENSGLVSGIKYQKEGKSETLEGKMVFVEIGQIPNTDNFKSTLDLNDGGEIIIDENNRTNIENVFAAGDITNVKSKQTIVACGEGAKAAIAINNFLEHGK